jgi:hypothetical protein
MKVESEIWQVRIQGQVYETDGETLKKWVGEGMLQPTDHVKKGSLNWIEAGLAPLLRPVFSGEETIISPLSDAPDAPVSHAPVPPAPSPAQASAQIASLMQEHGITPVLSAAEISLPASNACHFHPQLEPKFICRICSALFCRECPNFIGTSKVPLCKLCGDLCKPLDEVKEQKAHRQFQSSGFGFQDFRSALLYPFQNKTGLICGAAFYGFLLLAGFRGRILASAVLFGCISIVINKVAYGKMDRNFLPDLSEFSMWDDVIMPALLGIGVGIVTLGPTILLVVALLFGVFGGAAQTPTPPAPEGQTAQQEEQLTQEDFDALVRGDDPERDAETAKKLERLRPTYQMAQEAKKSEESQAQTFGVLAQFTGGPLLVVLLLLAALAWAVFYYPMALAVAGYTEDFASVVNPLIGLDTIRRMGFNYVKAFLMYAGVQLVGLVIGLVVGLVTAPFQMPFVGNLPATFLDGMITFYTSLVVACILGLALFKSADKLGLNFDN